MQLVAEPATPNETFPFKMSPEAGRHAVLLFIAIFGGAAIWFFGIIWCTRFMDRHQLDYRWSRVVALPHAIATPAFVLFVLSFW